MIDEVDLVAQEGVAKRKADAAERKALRQSPERKAARRKGRYSRNKGIREERATEDVLYAYGFIRNPDSGAQTGSDLVRPLEDGKTLRCGERKYSGDSAGFKTLYRYLEQSSLNDFLIVRGQGKQPLYVLTEAAMLRVLSEAGYDRFHAMIPGYEKWRYRQKSRPSLAKEEPK